MASFWCYSCAIIFVVCSHVSGAAVPLKIDPKAKNALEQVIRSYSTIKSYHSQSRKIISSPNSVIKTEAFDFKIVKPNRLYYCHRINSRGHMVIEYLIISDGSYLWEYDAATSTYTKNIAPKSLAKYPRIRFDSMDAAILTSDIKRDILYAPIESSLVHGFTYDISMGDSRKIDKKNLIVVKIIRNNDVVYNTMYYIGKVDHIIHRIVNSVTFSGAAGSATASDETKYDLMDPRAKFTAADFKFTPPPYAKLVVTSQDPKKY